MNNNINFTFVDYNSKLEIGTCSDGIQPFTVNSTYRLALKWKFGSPAALTLG